MQQTVTQKTLNALNEIKSKGFICPENNAIHSYYKQINRSLADFLKAKPVNPKDALACMGLLSEICTNTDSFSPLFSKTMMDLYDQAKTGNLLTQRQAETKLLFFLTRDPPSSVKQKNRLLTQIRAMPDFSERKEEIAEAVDRLVDHYVQNQQISEDPDLSILKQLSGLLRQVCESRKPLRLNGRMARAKASLHNCANLIKTHAPEFYEDSWQKRLAPRAPKKYNVPDIKEPAEVYSSMIHRSRSWERE